MSISTSEMQHYNCHLYPPVLSSSGETMILKGNTKDRRGSEPWSFRNVLPEETISEELKPSLLPTLTYLGRSDYLRRSPAIPLNSISLDHRPDHGSENCTSPRSSLYRQVRKGCDRPSPRRVLVPNHPGNVYGCYVSMDSDSSCYSVSTSSHRSEGFAVSEQTEDAVYILAAPSKRPTSGDIIAPGKKDSSSKRGSPSALDAAACNGKVPGVFSPDFRRTVRLDAVTKSSRFRLKLSPPIFTRSRAVSFLPYTVVSPSLSVSESQFSRNSTSCGSTPAPNYSFPWPSFVSAQFPVNPTSHTLAFPYSVSFTDAGHSGPSSEIFWLGLYFVFNLALTLYNKSVLVHFPFPYTLTAIHTLSGSVGCYALLNRGVFTLAEVDFRQTLALVGFSFLYTINIAISNLSLQLVTIPFHQVVRASSPIFTLIVSYVLFRTTVTTQKFLILMPLILGVALATYGDYHFTTWGLCLTLFGAFLAALKGIFTNVLQMRPIGASTLMSVSVARTRSAPAYAKSAQNLHPLDLLLRMSPLAFLQCLLYAWFSGELAQVWEYNYWTGTTCSTGKCIGQAQLIALGMNGFLAFALNYVSFTSNKKVGALTMTVAANIKQVLTILLAVSIFNVHITPVNSIGILLTLGGGACYAAVEYTEKTGKKRLTLGQALDIEQYRACLHPLVEKRVDGM